LAGGGAFRCGVGSGAAFKWHCPLDYPAFAAASNLARAARSGFS
jgi:hypothetical protein